MKKLTKQLTIIAFLLFSFVANEQLQAQGNVISVTPDSSELGSTVVLQISGHNTIFSQATTSLHKTTGNLNILPSSFSVTNDSLMLATFIIPNGSNYLGYYDVHAGLGTPLASGFRVIQGVLISGYIYADTNSNCTLDTGEMHLPYNSLIVQPGSLSIPIDNNGYYEINLPMGYYTATITYVPMYSGATISCPVTGTDTLQIATSVPITINNQNFGVSYPSTCASIQTWVSTGNMRPCSWHHTSISYQNLTPTYDPNVTITVTFDSFHNITGSSPAWTSNVGNVVTFHVPVGPFSTGYITVYDNNSCSAVLGTPSCIDVMAIPSNSGCVDSTISYSQTCINFSTSYDPNEKILLSPYGTNITPTDELRYMIGFQNTGNDTAFTIVVLDTLSYNLNPATLVPAPSDHPYTYQLIGSNIAKFTFNNINLPDSTTDQLNSHGFITYTIQQNPNNPPGTQILNTGNIYFDFNANVRTNTTFNQIPMATLGIAQNSITKDGISIYPNPFTNTTKFVFSTKSTDAKYTIQLYDIQGKKVKEVKNITDTYYELNRGDLKAQMYFYKVFDNENQVGTGKFVIMD